MKILRISLKNIASLAGTHTVDFTQEPLRSAGLFSISGPTGAGKSSLLDALCLALFDETPRLKHSGHLEQLSSQIQQTNTRTLLRRGCGSGFAEVVFIGVDEQIWTAHWSIRRARNRPGGRIQPPEMTLFRDNVWFGKDGTIEAGGKKMDVKRAIEEKIGLAFHQFTRAVLLAQNEFATFLKSSDKERAEILQALTGTEQFEQISRAVYERTQIELEAVRTLESRLQGVRPFTDEERRDAEVALQNARQKLKESDNEIRNHEGWLSWHLQRNNLHQEEIVAREKETETKQAADDAEHRREQLKQTEFARRESRALWQERQQAITAVEQTQKTLDRVTTLAAAAKEQLKATGTAEKIARKNLENRQAELKALEPRLQVARQLDAEIEPLRQAEQAAAREQQLAITFLQESQKKLDTQSATCCRLEEERLSQRPRVRQLAAYEPFLEDLTRWLHLLDDAILATSEGRQAEHLLDHLNDDVRQRERDLDDTDDVVRAQAKCHEAAQTALQTALNDAQQFDVERLAEERQRLDSDYHVVTRLQQQLDSLLLLHNDADQLRRELVRLVKSQKEALRFLDELRDDLVPAATTALDASVRQLLVIEESVSDEAHRLRASLQDGQACPVCGADHHPWSEHRPNAETVGIKAAKKNVDELREKLAGLKEKQRQLELSTSTGESTLAEKQERLEYVRREMEVGAVVESDHPIVSAVLRAESTAVDATVGERQITLFPELEAAASSEQHAAEISREVRGIQCARAVKELRGIEDARQQLAQQEASQRAAAAITDQHRQDEARQRQDLDAVLKRRETIVGELNVLRVKQATANSTHDAVQKRLKVALSGLSQLWDGLASSRDMFDADPIRFRQRFEAMAVEGRELCAAMSRLEMQLQSESSMVIPLQEAVSAAEENADRRRSVFEGAVAAHEKLAARRTEQLDGRDADFVENDAKCLVEEARSVLLQAQQDQHAADKQCQLTEQKRESAAVALKEAEQQRELASAAVCESQQYFENRFSRALSDEELQSMLDRSQEWLSGEREFFRTLDERLTATRTTSTDCRKRLATHDQQRPTDQDEESLLASLARLQTAQKTASAAVTDADSRLRLDDQQRENCSSLQRELAEQRNSVAPWEKLNDLIGSSGGDKFRMIAQRRTLDVLLRYANHQLTQLAARYRLERLPESLNLVVIDELMGDEERSVLSLSGGESFLVSLALALGLASLTSSRLRIESLFIDEGFGSLDPETLNTAMTALMHLEAQGRKVGVISHVSEMTDAIPVQIRVERRRAGASTLVVPGSKSFESHETDAEDE